MRVFACAIEKGFVSRAGAGHPLDPTVPTPQDVFLTAPESYFDNDINVGITRQRWYNMYQGRVPGIYRSYLECSLNVLFVSHAAHESFFSLEEAREQYQVAVAEDRIRVRI